MAENERKLVIGQSAHNKILIKSRKMKNINKKKKRGIGKESKGVHTHNALSKSIMRSCGSKKHNVLLPDAIQPSPTVGSRETAQHYPLLK